MTLCLIIHKSIFSYYYFKALKKVLLKSWMNSSQTFWSQDLYIFESMEDSKDLCLYGYTYWY